MSDAAAAADVDDADYVDRSRTVIIHTASTKCDISHTSSAEPSSVSHCAATLIIIIIIITITRAKVIWR